MPMNIVAFHVYIVTVLEYVAQLLEVPAEVETAMGWALRKLAPGPGTWATRKDLENPTEYGQQQGFRTITCTARAANCSFGCSQSMCGTRPYPWGVLGKAFQTMALQILVRNIG